jgi:hypothetical protein
MLSFSLTFAIHLAHFQHLSLVNQIDAAQVGFDIHGSAFELGGGYFHALNESPILLRLEDIEQALLLTQIVQD